MISRNTKFGLILTILSFAFLCQSVVARSLVDFDIETAAAEPRPIYAELPDSKAVALPLAYHLNANDNPQSVASEKVEKFLKPAESFAFNDDKEETKVNAEQDLKPAESFTFNDEKEVDESRSEDDLKRAVSPALDDQKEEDESRFEDDSKHAELFALDDEKEEPESDNLKPSESVAFNDEKKGAESKREDDLRPADDDDYYKYKNKETKEKPKEENQSLEGDKADLNTDGETAESKHHHHKKEHKDHHGGKFEKGGGKDVHSEHHAEHGEKGEKGYKGHHHHEKAEKGHHDKEHHGKEYGEHGGHKKEHHHDEGYHGEHHKGHSGKKGHKYDEKGEHSKGHSTKGSHSIHKKDEFEKKTEFFEEDHEGGDHEKHGGYHHKSSYKKGGHHKGEHKKGGHHEGHHGHKGEHEKGGFHHEEKGHHDKGGHDKHHEHHYKHGEKGEHGHGKKWGHKKSDASGGGGGHHGHHGSHSHVSVQVKEPPREHHEQQAQFSAPQPKADYFLPPKVLLPLENEHTNSENNQYLHVYPPLKADLKSEGDSDTFFPHRLAENITDRAEESEDILPKVKQILQKRIDNEENSKISTQNTQKEINNDTISFDPKTPVAKKKKRRLKRPKIIKEEDLPRTVRGVTDCHKNNAECQLTQESKNTFVIITADGEDFQ